MIAIFAAAALLVSADQASTTVNVHGMDRSAAKAALRTAAAQLCRSLSDDLTTHFVCVRNATDDAMRQYDELRARQPLLVADRR